MRCLFLSSLNMVFSRTHRYKSYLHKRSEAETGRIFYSPLRPAPPRHEKSSPRFAPPRFLKVFLLTALTPKTETERIFYSPLCFAPKKVFPASPRPVSSFYFSSSLRPAPPKMVPAPFRSL
jgi:hypothetical protein